MPRKRPMPHPSAPAPSPGPDDDFIASLFAPAPAGKTAVAGVRDARAGDSQPEVLPEPPEEPTLGEVLPVLAKDDPPEAPANLMSDEPFPGQTPDDSDRNIVPAPEVRLESLSVTLPSSAIVPQIAIHAPSQPFVDASTAPQPRPAPKPTQKPAPIAPGEPTPVPKPKPVPPPPTPPQPRFVQRITVTDAYQFDGRIQTAPAWIDRNWLSHDDEAKWVVGSGVVIDVPRVGKARIGDYIAQQHVYEDDGSQTASRMAVYGREEFERLFLPVIDTASADPAS
jgi:hypothetical protein